MSGTQAVLRHLQSSAGPAALVAVDNLKVGSFPNLVPRRGCASRPGLVTSAANVPKSVPIGHESGPGEISEGRFR
jgi:hypothetical protein